VAPDRLTTLPMSLSISLSNSEGDANSDYFDNLSSQSEETYLSDGMSSRLLAACPLLALAV
jgi:hypothetical protein